MRCIVCDKKMNSEEVRGYSNFRRMLKAQKLSPPLPFCNICYHKKGNTLKILDKKNKTHKKPLGIKDKWLKK